MIAGSGFTIGSTAGAAATALASTVSSSRVTLGRLAGAMYEVAMAVDVLVESMNDMSWIEIALEYWAYFRSFGRSRNRKSRTRRLQEVLAEKPIIPKDYG